MSRIIIQVFLILFLPSTRYKRTEANCCEMRNNTRTESAKHYLLFVIHHNKYLPESARFRTVYIRSHNQLRLRDMANSLVQTTLPEPLYLREISPELPVQRTSYRGSRTGAALIVKYKQDLLRRPSLTYLPPS